jgi:Zinc carboxypeptidase
VLWRPFLHSMIMKTLLNILLAIATVAPGYSQKIRATDYSFPDSVDTRTREIQYQEKKIFTDEEDGVYARNDFPGARLNNFERVNSRFYNVYINPENTPINNSAWYAFKIWSKEEKNVWLHFFYEGGEARYIPKLSKDGEHWQPIDSTRFTFVDKGSAMMNIDVSSDTLWIAAQEIMDSHRIASWANNMAEDKRVRFSTIGKSKLGRDLFFMELKSGKAKGKDVIAVFSRQHPPEVTGFMAMQAFLDELLVNEQSTAFFEKYRVLVYPLLNPDGVDLGHWRHNAGGIDLNRDWAYYRQPETRQVADHLANAIAKSKSRVVLGLDFHSTQKDVFYTLPDDNGAKTVIPWFKHPWLAGIEASIDNYELNESPDEIGSPVSKAWFYTQFNAEAVTYEVGDETPRDFIELKGRTAARQMMKVLLDHQE